MEQPIKYYLNLSLENIKYKDENGIEKEEQWKDIIGYEGRYMVSDLGRVKSLPKNRHKSIIKKANSNGHKGYLALALSLDGKHKAKYVHILVAEAFIPKPLLKRTVNHKNGVKYDNRVTELEWATYSENHLHAYKELGKVSHMVGKKGYKHHNCKRHVKCLNNGKTYSGVVEAGEDMGVDYRNVFKVCNGERHHTGGFNFVYL